MRSPVILELVNQFCIMIDEAVSTTGCFWLSWSCYLSDQRSVIDIRRDLGVN